MRIKVKGTILESRPQERALAAVMAALVFRAHIDFIVRDDSKLERDLVVCALVSMGKRPKSVKKLPTGRLE